MGKVTVSVVVPVFNEEKNLEEFHRELSGRLTELAQDWEIIFVDDGSSDRSCDILKALHEADARVRVIRLARHFGQNAALWAGLDNARKEIIVTMDADGQCPPSEIKKLAEKISDNTPLVIGRRRERKGPLWRRIGSRAYFALMRSIFGGRFPQDASPFRALRKNVLEKLRAGCDRGLAFSVIAAQAAVPFEMVHVEHRLRRSGRSKHSLVELAGAALDNLVASTGRFLYPAAALSIIGFWISLYRFAGLILFIPAVTVMFAYFHRFRKARGEALLYEIGNLREQSDSTKTERL